MLGPAARPVDGGEGEAEPATDVRPRDVLLVFLAALGFVFATRWPVMRVVPLETDEFGYLQTIRAYWWPMHHTLFLASGRAMGVVVGDAYRGFIVLDMLVSALGLVAAWWWLRALVRPAVAAAGALLLGVGPVYWTYGAVAGNYTAIVLVGSFLLGVVARTWRDPRWWHPYGAAVVLAWGTAYRQDIGTFWLPVFVVILWRHRWRRALGAGVLFTVLNLAWLGLMLHDVGGWERYRSISSEFAYKAGYLNSYWHLGWVDAPLRYAVKVAMALLWTFGAALFFAPRGLVRLGRRPLLAAVVGLSVVPALGSHLLVHFGVAGYAFHYVPAVIALVALGIGGRPAPGRGDRAPLRLTLAAALSALVFWFYPTDFDRPGLRGSFDLAFARQTRIGLSLRAPQRGPAYWRTANSNRFSAGLTGHDRLPEVRVRGN
jgi:hypothetical protein